MNLSCFVFLVSRDSKIILKPSNDPEQDRLEKDPRQSEHGHQSKSRLSTLEQLQYQLTTQVSQAGQGLCSIEACLLY